ncbi:hypothetical protein KIN20_006355 [Parelaphostrongylus tenuis]|uniref:Uncharacterized protein n=1 Tax=Parelaphostrongylus tenuis TaxID=148309 RepID=A0AAD5QGK9_PARTN|nr:hypothetical protein KIN20_006355 [Parelaphostrongylus tenuis]
MNAGRFPSIATSEASARGFVQRLVMQTIEYNPMNCPLVTGPEEDRESSALSNPFRSVQEKVQQASKLKMFTIPKEVLTLPDGLDNF